MIGSKEYILMVTGIFFVWCGAILYLYPVIFWGIPSLILGAIFIFTGTVLVGCEAILLAKKNKKSFYAILTPILLIIIGVWDAMLIISILRLLL